MPNQASLDACYKVLQLGCVCYCFACTVVMLSVQTVCCRYIDFTCLHAFIDSAADRYHTPTDNISQEFLLFMCFSVTVLHSVLDMHYRQARKMDKHLLLGFVLVIMVRRHMADNGGELKLKYYKMNFMSSFNRCWWGLYTSVKTRPLRQPLDASQHLNF